MPAFVRGAPSTASLHALAFGSSCVSIFGCENHIGWPAHYFAFRVAKKAFCASVPGSREAVGIHCENGKIRRTVDEELEEVLLVGRMPMELFFRQE